MALAEHLKVEGNSNTSIILTSKIHDLAFSLLDSDKPGDTSVDGFWVDPFQCFIAIENLQDNGHFREPKDVTSSLAAWTFVIRAIVFSQVVNTRGKGKNGWTTSVVFMPCYGISTV